MGPAVGLVLVYGKGPTVFVCSVGRCSETEGLVVVKVGSSYLPNTVELVGTAEIADLLGVSTQRVHQLAATPNFPKPVAVLTAGMIWQRSDIEQWMQSTGRAKDQDS